MKLNKNKNTEKCIYAVYNMFGVFLSLSLFNVDLLTCFMYEAAEKNKKKH
jgi:hypothetical protein